jgi:MFS superfamily sulfate permease-like transporter
MLRKTGLLARFDPRRIDWPVRETFSFSIPLLTTDAVYILRSSAIVILLEFFRGTQGVAEFKAVIPLAGLSLVVMQSFKFLYTPLAALAGVLLVVAYNMSELRMFRGLLRGPRSDVLVLVTTFALTVLVDLVVAIEIGVVLAALLFMRRMSEVSTVQSITDQLQDQERPGLALEHPGLVLPEGVEVFEVAGSFFFGSAQRFSEVLSEIHSRPRLVILRMRQVLALDSTGLHALEEVQRRLKRSGGQLILSGVHAQPMSVLVRSGALDRLGADNVLDSFSRAAVRAWELLEDDGRVPAAPASPG